MFPLTWIAEIYGAIVHHINGLASCGHPSGEGEFTIEINGKEVKISRSKGWKRPECCPDCFESAIIQCALCDQGILPGQGICLAHSCDEDWEWEKSAATVMEDGIEKGVCCLREDCNFGSPAFMNAVWDWPGVARRICLGGTKREKRRMTQMPPLRLVVK